MLKLNPKQNTDQEHIYASWKQQVLQYQIDIWKGQSEPLFQQPLQKIIRLFVSEKRLSWSESWWIWSLSWEQWV